MEPIERSRLTHVNGTASDTGAGLREAEIATSAEAPKATVRFHLDMSSISSDAHNPRSGRRYFFGQLGLAGPDRPLIARLMSLLLGDANTVRRPFAVHGTRSFR